MNSLLFLIPIGLVMLGASLWAFGWAVRHGQLDDLEARGRESFEALARDD